MIEPRVQALVKQACIATAMQGRRAYAGVCLYNTPTGDHCAIGHALTPDLQDLVGNSLCGVRTLVNRFPAVRDHLGNEIELWAAVQQAHDLSEGEASSEERPRGVSWSRWFWSRARNRCAPFGLDIGGFPRHLIGDAS